MHFIKLFPKHSIAFMVILEFIACLLVFFFSFSSCRTSHEASCWSWHLNTESNVYYVAQVFMLCVSCNEFIFIATDWTGAACRNPELSQGSEKQQKSVSRILLCLYCHGLQQFRIFVLII